MFSIEVQGLEAVRRRITSLPKQFRWAGHLALNDAAKAARLAVQAEIGKVFDRPTPFIQRSPWYGRATPERLVAAVGVGTELAGGFAAADIIGGVANGRSGGKVTDPASVLRAEVLGGSRSAKKAERAMQRVGLLQPGYAIVPAAAAPRDAYGNVPAWFYRRILAYFQAFGEQGFKQNLSRKSIARLAKFERTERGFKRIGGVQYFVSFGRLRGWGKAGEQHLRAGIWQRSGLHGGEIKPVFFFVPMPRYTQRLRMGETVARVAKQVLPGAFHQRLQGALRTAR